MKISGCLPLSTKQRKEIEAFGEDKFKYFDWAIQTFSETYVLVLLRIINPDVRTFRILYRMKTFIFINKENLNFRMTLKGNLKPIFFLFYRRMMLIVENVIPNKKTKGRARMKLPLF